MSSLEPSAPSQPVQQASFSQPQNPSSKTTAEKSASYGPLAASKSIEHRSAHDVLPRHGEAAKPSSLGSGDRGFLTEKLIPESDAQNHSRGEQVRPAGEGDATEAVRSRGRGGHAGHESLTEGIDRKQRDHEHELQRRGERTAKEIEDEEHEDWTGKKADIASALGDGRDGRDRAGRPPVVLAAED